MDAEPLILGFDTATLGGSVCLVKGEAVLAAIPGDPTISHSSTLLRDIERTLNAAGLSLYEVDLLAAAVGPGSFTGLRIGIASIKALSLMLKRPCAGIPTLHAVAHSAGPSKATLALLPAGRGEVFAQLFTVSSTGIVSELDNPTHLSPPALFEKYGHIVDLTWAGEGALLHQGHIREYALSQGFDYGVSTGMAGGWILAAGEDNLAGDIAILAGQRMQAGSLDDALSLQAIYVRPSDAELKKNVSQ
jgi:tRNA threonylcarbamoyladenosine biosynthesis protein TsaB